MKNFKFILFICSSFTISLSASAAPRDTAAPAIPDDPAQILKTTQPVPIPKLANPGKPVANPTQLPPTQQPVAQPSVHPAQPPVAQPTVNSTPQPVAQPTANPTQPVAQPIVNPAQPVAQPAANPAQPVAQPTTTQPRVNVQQPNNPAVAPQPQLNNPARPVANPAQPVQQTNPAQPPPPAVTPANPALPNDNPAARTRKIIRNPAQPQNPALPPQNPAQPPQAQNPVLPPPPVLPPIPVEEEEVVIEVENPFVPPPPVVIPVQPLPVERAPQQLQVCDVTTKQAAVGLWRGFVDWDCDNLALQPVNWGFYTLPPSDLNCCAKKKNPDFIPGFKVKFDGPYIVIRDNRIGGVVFQGAYNGFNVLQGRAYYGRSRGCWQLTRITPPPMCDMQGLPVVPPPPPPFLPMLIE